MTPSGVEQPFSDADLDRIALANPTMTPSGVEQRSPGERYRGVNAGEPDNDALGR